MSIPLVNMIKGDCMDFMRSRPDGYYDLAIVDPPYREVNSPTKSMRSKINGDMKRFGAKPNEEYFRELFRVSKNQVVWGGNNFFDLLGNTNCFLFWYKRNPMPNYSDGELAWTSFKSVARCIPIDHFGSHTGDKQKIHPTQKPVQLYKWILLNYANKGDKILDTHGGSGSIALACHELGYDLDWIELDKEYYESAMKRFKEYTSQTRMF